MSEHINVSLASGKASFNFLRAGISRIASPMAASLINRMFLILSIGSLLFLLVIKARNITTGIPKYLSKNLKIFLRRNLY
jgi:hypothetical protein